jgi:hypothetical protein
MGTVGVYHCMYIAEADTVLGMISGRRWSGWLGEATQGIGSWTQRSARSQH